MSTIVILFICFICAVTGYTIDVITPPIRQGEGPHWDNSSQALYFVDISGQKVFRKDYETGKLTSAHFNHGPVGAVVPVKNEPNQLLVACGKDLLLVDWDGKSNVINPPYRKLSSVDVDPFKNTRVNDGKCDRNGRFWIGTMGSEENGDVKPNQAALYRQDSQVLKKIMENVTISNGLAWNSRDDRMFYIDSPTKQIVVYDYDSEHGTIRNKRVVFDLRNYNYTGVPDGMTIDTDDNIWVAIYDNHAVLQINPETSRILRIINLPSRKVTSVAFGGPQLDTLFVTSGYNGVSECEREQQPFTGVVFAIKGLGVRGYPTNQFVL